MTHRTALNHSFLASLYLTHGRADMAECEIVRLVSWLALNAGLGTGWS